MSKIVSFCEYLLSESRKIHGRSLPREVLQHDDHAVAANLKIIEDVTNGCQELEEITTLDSNLDDYYDNEGTQDDVDSQPGDEDSQASSSVSQGWGEEILTKHGHNLETMKSIIEFYDNCKSKKFEQTQRMYRYITHKSQISNFRKIIAKNGTKADKFKALQEFVFQQFVEARDGFLSVHDNDLKRWGVMKSNEIELEFVASNGWVNSFKKNNRIVSRKITKVVSKRQILNEETIRKSGEEFVENVKEVCLNKNIPSGGILNFDQSGFSYEFMPTHSEKGEKTTFGFVKNMNAGTHSYTIMPLISMDGKLKGKLLICLQEVSGKLGPRVEKNLVIRDNVYLKCSKSGKLDKRIMKEWVEENLKFVCESTEKVALVYDSWSGHSDPSLYESIPNIVSQFKIPPHTTCSVQPLNKYFFRQYKLFMRAIRDRIMLDGLEIDMHARQNIIDVNSLIFNLLSSPKFYPMLQYSWYACSYVDQRPIVTLTSVQHIHFFVVAIAPKCCAAIIFFHPITIIKMQCIII